MIGLLYKILANVAGPFVVLVATLKGRFGGHWRQRLGLSFYTHPQRDVPRIWVHGASVGEIKSAASVIKSILELQPQTLIYLSSGTPAGISTALHISQKHAQVIPLAAPLDFWGAPGRTLTRMKPQLLIIMETELWPELIGQARKHGVSLMLAAGRLSSRSFKRYSLGRSFMGSLLNKFDLLAVSGPEEKERFASLGAPPERLTILGNPKFDQLLDEAQSQAMADKIVFFTQKLWGETTPNPLIVAGSTHPGEEEIILKAFQTLLHTHPDLKLVLAPRHLNRVPNILELVRKEGLAVQTSTSGEPPWFSQDRAQAQAQGKVLILDSLGDLNALYGLSQISLVGGSLLPNLNGHNPLEPAAMASPIIFGPYMPSFKNEARALLEVRGAMETTAESLAHDLDQWLKHPEEAQAAGLAAKSWLANRPASAPALARATLELFQARPGPTERQGTNAD